MTSVKALEDATFFIMNNNFDADSKICFTTLMKILDNILQQPTNEKVRCIRLGNAAFSSKVGTKKGGIEFLLACGFERKEPSIGLLGSFGSSPAEEQLVLENEDTNHLVTARRMLATKAVQDLGMRHGELPVFQPPAPKPVLNQSNAEGFNPYQGHRFDAQSAAVGTNLGPDANYVSRTETELQRLEREKKKLESKIQKPTDREWVASLPGQAAPVPTASSSSSSSTKESQSQKGDSALLAERLKKQQEERNKLENGGFTTKAMRDLEKLKTQKVYSHALLTIQFPDGCKLTGKFLPKEKIETVMRAMQDCLETDVSFELYVAPPRRVLSLKAKLEQEGLVPAAKLFVSWKGTLPSKSPPGWYIRSSLFSNGGDVAFPSAEPIAAAKKADGDLKPKAKSDDKSSREDNLLRRMMGGRGAAGSSKPSASEAADKSKKPKWFKG